MYNKVELLFDLTDSFFLSIVLLHHINCKFPYFRGKQDCSRPLSGSPASAAGTFIQQIKTVIFLTECLCIIFFMLPLQKSSTKAILFPKLS